MQNMQQNTKEWIDFRKDKIGASDLPIILGISPYCTSYELWRKKLGFSKEEPETQAMTRGKNLESYVRDLVNVSTDYHFDPDIFVHPNMPWAIASLDGISENKRVVLEIKCTSKKNHDLVRSGSIPDLFYPQIQWQLFVSGCDSVLLVHYFGDEKVSVTEQRDDVYIESTLLPAARDFYRCMMEITPPEMLEKDYVMIQDPEFENLSKQWIELKIQKSFLEEQENILREKLIEFTDDGNCQGFGLLLRKKSRKGSIAWEQLWKEICEKYQAEKLFNPELYRKKETTYWEIKEKQ